MKHAPKITVIGAGSSEFGLSTLATVVGDGRLRGSELALVDLNEASLELVAQATRRMSDAWDAGMTVVTDTERTAVLADSDFVIIATEVPPREALWEMDWEIPLKHGLRQPYGENGGPGGLMHACRQIAQILPMAKDMERLCPDAWLINFSNPLPRLTRAISRYTDIKVAGKCHQIDVGYALVACLLHERFNIDVPAGITLHSGPDNILSIRALSAAGRRHVEMTSAGLNHFIWLWDVRDKVTGEDLYPQLRAAASTAPPTLEPFSLHLLKSFGFLPLPGDTHLVEYLPWAHDPLSKPWEYYHIALYKWGEQDLVRQLLHSMLVDFATGRSNIDGLREAKSEGSAEIMGAMVSGETFHDEAINIPNHGAIANLPPETIVEIPGTVSASGIEGVSIGELPAPIGELLRREAALVELVVETAVSGNKQLALQTLLLDPMINDIRRAEAILDDYLRAFSGYLPQFE